MKDEAAGLALIQQHLLHRMSAGLFETVVKGNRDDLRHLASRNMADVLNHIRRDIRRVQGMRGTVAVPRPARECAAGLDTTLAEVA
jgi:hypothetical protein